jgi:hypothetical protein
MDISAAAKLKHGSPVWVWHTDLGPDVEGRWQPGTVLKVLTSGGSTSLWVFLESMESIAALSTDAEGRNPRLRGQDKPRTILSATSKTRRAVKNRTSVAL